MSDTKHGWVTPRADGARARCGGPGVCATCDAEAMHEKMLTGVFGTAAVPAAQPSEAVNRTALDIARAALTKIGHLPDVEADHRGVIVREALTEIDRLIALHAANSSALALSVADLAVYGRSYLRISPADWAENQAAPAAGDARSPALNIEAAAKALAECMDYPWSHMPEQGREAMRQHAQTVIRAASQQQEG